MKITIDLDSPELLEKLAAIEHDRWAGWMQYQAEHCYLTGIDGKRMHASGEQYAERWERQAATPYAELTEAEKEADRIEVRRTLDAIREYAS